jgi:vacuolar-type H+-ATPase subunit E/Vma4
MFFSQSWTVHRTQRRRVQLGAQSGSVAAIHAVTDMARTSEPAYLRGMETQAEIVTRWRYLRQLLIEQLAKFESGELKIHSATENVSAGAIERLKREIEDFDGLIAVSDRRDAQG